MGSQPAQPHPEARANNSVRRHAGAPAVLTDSEQTALLERSARGDRASSDRLVAANMAMVVRQANARAGQGLSISDLVQEGSLGLVEAVRQFAGSGRDDFGRFAEERVGRQMDDAIAAETSAVREAQLLVEAANDYERVEISLRRELRRDPSATEIAQKLEWTVERTQYVAEVVADARRRHDEELLPFIDPDAVDIDDLIGG